MNEGERPALIPYESEDGSIRLDVKLNGGTVWLTQEQMAELFGVDRSGIARHIGTIYESGELDEATTRAKNAQVVDGKRTYFVAVYNLDVIIHVGYRVNSTIAVKFRKWATQFLKEYMVKGFVLDDDRLSRGGEGFGGTDYFDELLERVRKIRTSETMFYQKVKDVFSVTSRDYDPKSVMAQDFYRAIQNKFHYAVTGQKEHAGLTTFKGTKPTVAEAKIAKNYMLETELRRLYLISEQFLSFAELTVETQKAMTMAQWSKRLDDMLALNDLGVLSSAGSVSHAQMEQKVKAEMAKFRKLHKLPAADGVE